MNEKENERIRREYGELMFDAGKQEQKKKDIEEFEKLIDDFKRFIRQIPFTDNLDKNVVLNESDQIKRKLKEGDERK